MILGNKKPQKNPKYFCENCCFDTNNKKDFDRHLLTLKHLSQTERKHEGNIEKPIMIHSLKCPNCLKEYKNRSSLWKHKKLCMNEEQPIENKEIVTEPNHKSSTEFTPDLFMEVLKQSKELQNVLIEQNEKLQTKLLEKTDEFQNTLKEQNSKIMELAQKQSVVNNTMNNQFNLNFFLNETCKDAMNIVDFVNSLKLTIHDFETTGKLGFVEGISRIFIKELRNMEIEKLPIHCTDLKRETLYIKDNDKWEKENDEKRRFKWAINKVAQLNLNQIQNWQLAYPESIVNNTPANEKFTELALVALGGRGEEQENKFREKIMKNVLKEVVLDKKSMVK